MGSGPIPLASSVSSELLDMHRWFLTIDVGTCVYRALSIQKISWGFNCHPWYPFLALSKGYLASGRPGYELLGINEVPFQSVLSPDSRVQGTSGKEQEDVHFSFLF